MACISTELVGCEEKILAGSFILLVFLQWDLDMWIFWLVINLIWTQQVEKEEIVLRVVCPRGWKWVNKVRWTEETGVMYRICLLIQDKGVGR